MFKADVHLSHKVQKMEYRLKLLECEDDLEEVYSNLEKITKVISLFTDALPKEMLNICEKCFQEKESVIVNTVIQ